MFSVFLLSLVLSLLVLESLGLGLDKRVVVAVVRVEVLAVKMNDVGSNCVEKLAVMGNHQNGRRPRLSNNYINSNNINNNNNKYNSHIFIIPQGQHWPEKIIPPNSLPKNMAVINLR